MIVLILICSFIFVIGVFILSVSPEEKCENLDIFNNSPVTGNFIVHLEITFIDRVVWFFKDIGITAQDEKEAHTIAYQQAIDQFPYEDGWSNHTIRISPVLFPHEMIEETE
jgi:hypothetical protein